MQAWGCECEEPHGPDISMLIAYLPRLSSIGSHSAMMVLVWRKPAFGSLQQEPPGFRQPSWKSSLRPSWLSSTGL
ncbi:hypothetical protein VNO78_18819 [Psophocarpus tetragonolobus]|uniref:Uncharacterized protein n=1 Tax=Psophocarpus tetragonolobus TaxID=3891 RepID=A0AAN9XFW8_PSOTE